MGNNVPASNSTQMAHLHISSRPGPKVPIAKILADPPLLVGVSLQITNGGRKHGGRRNTYSPYMRVNGAKKFNAVLLHQRPQRRS